MKKIIKTEMLKSYIGGFLIRAAVFITMAILYLWYKPLLESLIRQPIRMGITPIHVLWFVWMVFMITHLFPNKKMTMALRKKQQERYKEIEGYSELELLRFVKEQNVKAWYVLLLWLCFNAIFGALYLVGLLDNTDLIMLSVFYFLCDYICIVFFCPFQTGIMKNKCCVNCRIFDWGHFMMFTPMLFIKNFFSWSLFFTSCHEEYSFRSGGQGGGVKALAYGKYLKARLLKCARKLLYLVASFGLLLVITVI